MEQVIAILFQIILELFMAGFGDLIVYSTENNDKKSKWPSIWAGVIVGVIVGFISIEIIDHHVLDSSSLRVANLIIMPVLNGLLSYYIADLVSRSKKVDKGKHVAFVASFTLFYLGIRTAFI